MNYIELNDLLVDTFTVLDGNLEGVTGLVTGDFIFELTNPSGVEVSGTVPVTVTELTNGNYRGSFTPNVIGSWTFIVYHATHLPVVNGGVSNTYECVVNLKDIHAILVDTSDTLQTLITNNATDLGTLMDAITGYLIVPEVMQKPLNGLFYYRVLFYTFDGRFNPISTSPSIEIVETDGTVVIADTAMTVDPETGHYHYDFEVDNTEIEQVLIVKVTVGSRYFRASTEVLYDKYVDSSVEDKIDDIKLKTDELPDDTEAILLDIQSRVTSLEDIIGAVYGYYGNKITDQQTYVNGRLVSARIRIYSDNTFTVVLKTIIATSTYDIFGNNTLFQLVES